VLRGALRARNVIEFRYRDAEGVVSRREVQPLALSAFSEGWLLIAWCRLREDFRVFRLDRMSVVQPTGQTFTDEPGQNLATYLSVRGPYNLARSPAWIG
jgi:predicted DNA-binding transcriptional regulator YafY